MIQYLNNKTYKLQTMFRKIADYEDRIPRKIINFNNRFEDIRNNISNPFHLIDIHKHHEAREDAQEAIQFTNYQFNRLQMFQQQNNQPLYLLQDEQLRREKRGREIQMEMLKKKHQGKNQNVQNYSDDQEQSEFPYPFTKYKIIPAQQQKLALDVTSIQSQQHSLHRGKLIIWEYHGGSNQHFYIKRIKTENSDKNNITCLIINASTGFLLDSSHPEINKNNDFQVATNPLVNRTPKPSQIWKIEKCGYDLYDIRSCYGMVLDVMHGKIVNGSQVITYKQKQLKQGKNQKWRIWPS